MVCKEWAAASAIPSELWRQASSASSAALFCACTDRALDLRKSGYLCRCLTSHQRPHESKLKAHSDTHWVCATAGAGQGGLR